MKIKDKLLELLFKGIELMVLGLTKSSEKKDDPQRELKQSLRDCTPHQPATAYNYIRYRQDLLLHERPLNEILEKMDGTFPDPPRFPKLGEMWEWKKCTFHADRSVVSYPMFIRISRKEMIESTRPFIYCGCVTFVTDVDAALFIMESKGKR